MYGFDELYNLKKYLQCWGRSMRGASGGGAGGAGGGASGGGASGGASGGDQCSTGGDGGEKQCSVDGYCKGDTCLEFSPINGDSGPSLDSYYSTIDKVEKGPSPESSDDYRSQKKSSFDSEYERMMSERSEMNNGGQPQQINFSR